MKDRYQQIAIEAAKKEGIDPNYILPLIETESNWNPNAVSNKGAAGLMQIMPNTAVSLGLKPEERFIPEKAIPAGVKYWAEQYKRFGKPELAHAAYNAGPTAVSKYGGIPPFKETQNYVRKNMEGYKMAQSNKFDQFDKRKVNKFDQYESPADTAVMTEPDPRFQRVNPLGTGESVWHGLTDPVYGGYQMAAHLPGVPEQFKNSADQKLRSREFQYQLRRNAGGEEGIDWGRLGGTAIPAFAGSRMLPFSAAKSMGGVAANAGMTGAGLGALTPDLRDDTSDFWTNKLINTVTGGATAAVLAPPLQKALQVGGVALSSLLGRFKGAASSMTPQQVEIHLRGQFRQAGMDWDKLPQQMQQSMLIEANRALSKGKSIDPKVMARQADFEMLGMKPMQGQITRDPIQFANEQNMAGINNEAGRMISERLAQQNQQLVNAGQKIRPAGGTDPYNAGQRMIDGLRQVGTTAKQQVDDAYNTARNSAGLDTQLRPNVFSQRLNDELDKAMIGDALPSGVRDTINKIARGEMPFTLRIAEQMRQAINGQMTNMPSRENAALQRVLHALQAEVDDVGGSTAARQAFLDARSLYSQYAATLDKNPALQAVVKDMATPDDFIKKYIISAKAGDVMNLGSQLKKADPKLWDEAKGQVIDWLWSKATQGANPEMAKFSQAAYNKALQSINDGKLKAMFTPSEIEYLKRVGRVAAAKMVPPDGAAVNTSKTSQALYNLFQRATGLPFVKDFVADPMASFMARGAAKSALNPTVPVTPYQSPVVDYLTSQGSRLSPAVVPPLLQYLNQ